MGEIPGIKKSERESDLGGLIPSSAEVYNAFDVTLLVPSVYDVTLDTKKLLEILMNKNHYREKRKRKDVLLNSTKTGSG
jgi:hypothetical protein